MVRLNPDYTENIIVMVCLSDIYNWYVTDKEIWFLDYKKRMEAFKNIGYQIKEEYIDNRRKDLLLLDSQNACIFLDRIKDDKVTTEELRSLLLKSREIYDDTWKYDFRPSLYVNFDTCTLYSLYSEPASYEDYVPLNWTGRYYDFLELIPDEQRYWLDQKSVNLLL